MQFGEGTVPGLIKDDPADQSSEAEAETGLHTIVKPANRRGRHEEKQRGETEKAGEMGLARYRSKKQKYEASKEQKVHDTRDNARKIGRCSDRAKKRKEVNIQKTGVTVAGMHAVVSDEMNPIEVVRISEMDEGIILNSGPGKSDPKRQPQTYYRS